MFWGAVSEAFEGSATCTWSNLGAANEGTLGPTWCLNQASTTLVAKREHACS
jgi:hypothetical protein